MAPSDTAPDAYDEIVERLTADGAVASKMFGMPALMVGGKAFAGNHRGEMVFKLSGAAHARAMALPGAHLFDPSGRGRPMKEWIQVPATSQTEWPELASDAMAYVSEGLQSRS